MNYVVFDLEFNQGSKRAGKGENSTNPGCPFEIIQIGAVKLDDNLRTVDCFNKLVKPQLYTEMNPYVAEITGMTIEQLEDARTFNEVGQEFASFVKGRNVFCIWGMSDMRELFRNMEFHGLDTSMLPKECINLQHHVSKLLHCPKGTCIGLGAAVELLEIPSRHQFHDAFNDAFYTAEVFKKTFTKDMKPKFYNSSRHRRPRGEAVSKKCKLDAEKLLMQFERMFHREITPEEHAMIKLAYMMGRTGQFQVEERNSSNKD